MTCAGLLPAALASNPIKSATDAPRASAPLHPHPVTFDHTGLIGLLQRFRGETRDMTGVKALAYESVSFYAYVADDNSGHWSRAWMVAR